LTCQHGNKRYSLQASTCQQGNKRYSLQASTCQHGNKRYSLQALTCQQGRERCSPHRSLCTPCPASSGAVHPPGGCPSWAFPCRASCLHQPRLGAAAPQHPQPAASCTCSAHSTAQQGTAWHSISSQCGLQISLGSSLSDSCFMYLWGVVESGTGVRAHLSVTGQEQRCPARCLCCKPVKRCMRRWTGKSKKHLSITDVMPQTLSL
jgi:hypothetical protein